MLPMPLASLPPPHTGRPPPPPHLQAGRVDVDAANVHDGVGNVPTRGVDLLLNVNIPAIGAEQRDEEVAAG